jgi:hypothetical protein
MIEIIQYEPEHIDEIMKHPREWEMRLSSHPDWNAWKLRWKKEGPSYTLMVDRNPIFCAGMIIMENGIGEAWTVMGFLMPKYMKSCFKAIKKYMDEIIGEYRLSGVQAFIDPAFNGAKHLMTHLGFIEDKPLKVCGMDMIRFWRAC